MRSGWGAPRRYVNVSRSVRPSAKRQRVHSRRDCPSPKGTRRRLVLRLNSSARIGVALIALALGFAVSNVRAAPAEIAQIARLPAAEACDALEALLARRPAEPLRRVALELLRDKLPDAAPPPTKEEQQSLDQLRKDHPAGTQLLRGRYALALCTPKFAARASETHLLVQLDLAYVALRELFAVDPVRLKGHRIYIFPHATKPWGYTFNSDWLILLIGRGDWDNADSLDGLIHEYSHGFINHGRLEHWRREGFGEGWADFAPAYVSDRLAPLGPPFAGRWEGFLAMFRRAGRIEYLQTRLPIEEIVSYTPASSFLAELMQTTRKSGRVDGEPFRRMYADAAQRPPAFAAAADWPQAMARDALNYFGDTPAVRKLLRNYRFPPEAELARFDARRGAAPPENCPDKVRLWEQRGERVIRRWKMLGPFSDPSAARLALTPIDEWNVAAAADPLAGLDWKDSPPTDACGTLQLDSIPGGAGPCVFYLLARLEPHDRGEITFSIASDDDVSCWLGGRRFHVRWVNRGVYVDQPDRAYVSSHGGEWLLCKVANQGGHGGLHVRYRVEPDAATAAADLHVADPAERALAAVWHASRHASSDPPRFLFDSRDAGLADPDAAVRAAAAQALGRFRNSAPAVDALVRAWAGEKDASAGAAMGESLAELTLTNFKDAGSAARWWERHREEFANWHFVECESAYGRDVIVGGFFGNPSAAMGRQCVSRDWGGSRDHRMELPIFASWKGPRTLRLRYACARPDGSRLNVTLRRGEKAVFERRDIAVPTTRDANHFRWLTVAIPPIEQGTYRLVLTTDGRGIECDVLGWK